MERRGGCCIDVYGGGGGGDAAAAWRMGRIMLRFRPIAPKPVVDSSWAASAAAAAESSAGRKTRRKGSGGSRGRKARKVETSRSSSPKDDPASSSPTTSSPSTIVTLSLMPEIPERKDDRAAERRCLGSEQPLVVASLPAWMDRGRAGETAGVALPETEAGSYSWVTVECVADMWTEEEVSWRSDEAVWAALAADDCPGFVSDKGDRVTWTNEAYRRMVAGITLEEGRGTEEEVRVGLMTRGAVPAEASRAFTCRVRLHYSRRPGTSSLAAPCDVWRLDGGGRAWRLDLKAALSLSL